MKNALKALMRSKQFVGAYLMNDSRQHGVVMEVFDTAFTLQKLSTEELEGTEELGFKQESVLLIPFSAVAFIDARPYYIGEGESDEGESVEATGGAANE